LKEYITYLVKITQDRGIKTIIVKVDQTDKVNRPNNIDDDEWITQLVGDGYGDFNEIETTNLSELDYEYLDFEEE